MRKRLGAVEEDTKLLIKMVAVTQDILLKRYKRERRLVIIIQDLRVELAKQKDYNRELEHANRL